MLAAQKVLNVRLADHIDDDDGDFIFGPYFIFHFLQHKKTSGKKTKFPLLFLGTVLRNLTNPSLIHPPHYNLAQN